MHYYRSTGWTLLAALAAIFPSGKTDAADDFRWVRGANYVASYAATDVEMWLNYDHDTIDRELGFAKKLRLNCVRVFLQSLVYHNQPDKFLADFDDFLSTANAHGLKVMPVLFDSCFGVAPSLESRHMWVANPGPDRMTRHWWPESDTYTQAVVSAHVGDDRIAIWDVMNEPTATHLAVHPEGKARIDDFVVHYCRLVQKLDRTHPITVGVAKWDNSDVLNLVDVLSCHSYARGVEAFRADVARTRDQARAAGKPWIVTECCNVAAGSTYEMAMPVLREFGVGFFCWQIVIGRDMFNSAAGLVYPDGSVRRIEQIEAVLDGPADAFVEKPDEDGVPLGDNLRVRLMEYLDASVHDGVTEVTWRERSTQVEALLALPNVFGDDKQRVHQQLIKACASYDEGRKDKAFSVVHSLLKRTRDSLHASNPTFVPAKRPRATVYRDVHGVPHIYADSEAAGAYAMALEQCEDMGMEVFNSLRVGIGRRAEVFGEKLVESDRDLHLWRVPETAEKSWRESPARTKRFIQAFCDGLNDYRKAHPDECKHALEAQPVQVLALLRMTDVQPSMAIVSIEANAALNQSPLPLDFPHQSSTWVLGPSRTASGRPILFIDPHWPIKGHASWWEFHLHAGRLQVGGFAMPGVPLAGLGYTAGVAWSATAGGADSADAFEIKINPQNAKQYWYDGRWRDMVIREAKIRVRTESGEVEDRVVKLRETVHGPIVRQEGGRAFAGAICGINETKKLEQWLAMNRATTSEQFCDAIRMDQAAWLNLTYAAKDGHFGYIQTGMCPLRTEEHYRRVGAQDGTRSIANWRGRVSFNELPQLHDPETGWLQSCNTAAYYTTSGQTMTPQDFPPGVMFGHVAPAGAPNWRGRALRCFQAMPKMRNVTHKQARRFALDTFAPAGPIWVGPLLAAYQKNRSKVADPDLSMKIMADALREWDFRVDKDSVGATVFRYWRSEYGKLQKNSLGINTAKGFPATPQQQLNAVKALRAAADHLKETYQSPLVPWGQILRLQRGDVDLPLDGDTAFAGGTECLRATGTVATDGKGHYLFSGGQVIPTIVELSDPIQVWSIVPFGQSRRPESRHYTSQAHLYSEGRMRPAWHTWVQLRDHVETKKVVEYPGR